MSILFSLLSVYPSLTSPQDWSELLVMVIGWLLFLCGVVALLYYWRGYAVRWSDRNRMVWIGLLILVPVTSLFLGIRLSPSGALTPPKVPIDSEGPALMIFAFLPWVLAGGMLGPLQTALTAAFSGLILALWGTHNAFTPLELTLFATMFGVGIQQRYRTLTFRALRHPLALGILFALVYPLISIFSTSLIIGGSLPVRIDYAITHLGGASFAFAGSLLIACTFAEIFALTFPTLWGSHGILLSSPVEKSLEARFLYTLGPLVFVLAMILMVGAWNVAETTSRKMIRDRLTNLAFVTSEGVSPFLEVGQNLIQQLAGDPRLYSSSPSELAVILEDDLRTVPYFRQLYILDEKGNSLAGYRELTYDKANASPEEQYGIYRTLDGISMQIYSAAPAEGGKAAQISFLAAIFDQTGVVRGVLIGRTDLAENPFTAPILANLDSLGEVQGEGVLLDQEGRILYDQNPGLLMTPYSGRRTETAEFYDEAGPDGIRRLVYYQPVRGQTLAVALSVPARQAQQIAITIAAPISGIVLLISVLGAIYFHFSLRGVTGSLSKLADQAGKITQGELNFPVEAQGEDEVGSLSKAFEQMRVSLKARLDEQDRLLWVSQGVASSLDISESVHPVLESALATGACSARVALSPEVLPEMERNAQMPASYKMGLKPDRYGYLDEQILSRTRQQDRLVLTNPRRPHLLIYPPGAPVPEAVLAIALRNENLFYGVLWIAFERPHQFSEDEVRFVATLASHAALAVANSRHYLNAEVGRQRLEAILNSTPDPVLVIDQQNRLLLANPAAWQTLGLGVDWQKDQGIEKVISNPELLDLLISPSEEVQSREVIFADGKVYSATTSPVLTEGKSVGRICVLRDVTYFKDLDKLKSEFVATVSHDLRSPLTLMRGYATMLEMVGELNEQQVGYIRKILGSVESMSRLVGNLLDLGRIEAGVGLQLELVPVRDVLERVVGGLQLQAAQKRIQLSLNVLDQAVPLLEADQALLQQALQNLVENAIKFNEAGGNVQVGVISHQGRMVFEISDTGIGIANVDQAHIFDKFYRVVQPGGKQTGGTGLGLAIVKSIAERHGGETWLKSQLGKGSTFYLALPLRQPSRE